MEQNDEIKGRAEEAVGVLTDAPRLINQGKVNEAKGKVKKAVEFLGQGEGLTGDIRKKSIIRYSKEPDPGSQYFTNHPGPAT